ncbi:hypothetical protein [Rhizobacter fulvus]
MTSVTRILTFLASTCVLTSVLNANAVAQSLGYTRLNVRDRVLLEVPENWTIRDAEGRKSVTRLAEKITGVQDQHVASLSAQSSPSAARVSVRASFINLSPPISQSDAREDAKADRNQVVRDLDDLWKAESAPMWVGLAKMGSTEVGRAAAAVEMLGGQLAWVFRYARTSTINPAETMMVAQYHVPMGADKVLITLSYIDKDKAAMAAHDRLKSSIVIRQ